MDRNFSRCLGAVLEEEGGFSNHPRDPGGATMRGVTLESFRAFVKPDASVDDLKAITAEQAGVVYRRHYWDKVLGASLPDGVDHAVFDFAVNSGPVRAVNMLQAIVGAKVDGHVGPETLRMVGAMDADMIITALCDRRLAFLQSLGTWDTFGKGWAGRVERVRKLAMELAAQPKDAPIVVEKHIDVPIPVTPAGADKRAGTWFNSLWLFVLANVGAFMDLPLAAKLTIFVATAASAAFLIWRGEVIIRRIKALVGEIYS